MIENYCSYANSASFERQPIEDIRLQPKFLSKLNAFQNHWLFTKQTHSTSAEFQLQLKKTKIGFQSARRGEIAIENWSWVEVTDRNLPVDDKIRWNPEIFRLLIEQNHSGETEKANAKLNWAETDENLDFKRFGWSIISFFTYLLLCLCYI